MMLLLLVYVHIRISSKKCSLYTHVATCFSNLFAFTNVPGVCNVDFGNVIYRLLTVLQILGFKYGYVNMYIFMFVQVPLPLE